MLQASHRKEVIAVAWRQCRHHREYRERPALGRAGLLARCRSGFVAAVSLLALIAFAPDARAATDLVFIDGFQGCPIAFRDADADGYGNGSKPTDVCGPPAGYVANATDCNDGDVAVHPGATDLPDAQFKDDNCDGIDGDIARAAFVAPSGIDSGNCPKTAPCATIGYAIGKAGAAPALDHVYVRGGDYNETVSLATGVAVFGGYDANWARADRTLAGHSVRILGGVRATGVASTQNPTVENLSIESPDATGPGANSIAVLLTNSSGIAFARVGILAGDGAPGAPQSAQPAGDSGGDGGAGNPGCENSTLFCGKCDPPAGGPAGTSTCEHSGGIGGTPGLSNNGGAAGGTGVSGTSGGPGAACGGSRACDGTAGTDGAAGTPGISGSGGAAIGAFANGAYVPAAGGNGTSAGGPGQGGGGGGGGGGGTTDCDSYGSSGGGGGGGGCGAQPGVGGGGGGGSFGAILSGSSATFSSSLITTSVGGMGGAGGSGGDGGIGGALGPAGTYGGSSGQDDGGDGADGGRGGDGGHGGHGGGGGGGPSIAIVCAESSTATVSGSTLVPGSGGLGGASSGTPGQLGTSAMKLGCP
jgi:hypothetical protein